jgi:hypothetical protein
MRYTNYLFGSNQRAIQSNIYLIMEFALVSGGEEVVQHCEECITLFYPGHMAAFLKENQLRLRDALVQTFG